MKFNWKGIHFSQHYGQLQRKKEGSRDMVFWMRAENKAQAQMKKYKDRPNWRK